jgi:hypothetical protein
MQSDVDWQAIQAVVDYCVAHNKLPEDSKAALKRQLCDRKDLKTVLVALTVGLACCSAFSIVYIFISRVIQPLLPS